jgi:undecaprenyl-diphosphatase
MALKSRIKNKTLKVLVNALIIAFIAFMVIGRIIAGVHWISDIIGGALISTGLVLLYYSFTKKT